ncbi:hypothetical protein CALCODRAFT_120609 [Calocera cornea HHB12733]|uniref:Uncharacterized protein n=1 Tax=Calocera cornea HHB12733 TaxID=1353952 RepID=A0A165CZE8_9BASI|nr:hypothetical protein CALCODRAFT_120609 [Calocera cornea HHB12733]
MRDTVQLHAEMYSTSAEPPRSGGRSLCRHGLRRQRWYPEPVLRWGENRRGHRRRDGQGGRHAVLCRGRLLRQLSLADLLLSIGDLLPELGALALEPLPVLLPLLLAAVDLLPEQAQVALVQLRARLRLARQPVQRARQVRLLVLEVLPADVAHRPQRRQARGDGVVRAQGEGRAPGPADERLGRRVPRHAAPRCEGVAAGGCAPAGPGRGARGGRVRVELLGVLARERHAHAPPY